MHVKCYYLISFYVFQAISKLNMDNNYSAILQERRNILHLNNLYVLRRCMQVAILLKILTCQPTWYIREVYSCLPERPEIVRLPPPPQKKNQVQLKKKFILFSHLDCCKRLQFIKLSCIQYHVFSIEYFHNAPLGTRGFKMRIGPPYPKCAS